MRIVLRAGIWLMGLLLPVGMLAQTVPTTNEVRAMRGLGPVEVQGTGNSHPSEQRPLTGDPGRDQGTEQGVRGE